MAKYGRIDVTRELLRLCLNLPEGVEITGAAYSHHKRVVELSVEGAALPDECLEFNEIQVTPRFRTDGNKTIFDGWVTADAKGPR